MFVAFVTRDGGGHETSAAGLLLQRVF
jgi:hypothetical protein